MRRSSPSQETTNADLLTHTSHNDTSLDTILLIHGAGTTGADWNRVIAHLPTQYHILTPSLFTPHSLSLTRRARISQSSAPDDRNWQSAYGKELAKLLADRAHRGQAHIVGLSLGARLALAVASIVPSRVLSLFVSGLPTPIASTLPRPLAISALWTITRAEEALGLRAAEAALEGRVQFTRGGWDGCGAHASVEMMSVLVEMNNLGVGQVVIEEDWERRERLRVRIVAGTRRTRWAPFGDTVETAVAGARAVVGADAGTRIDCHVLEAPNMLQWVIDDLFACLYDVLTMTISSPWNNQSPSVFAQCILATVEGGDFPTDEMKEIWRS